MITFKEIEKTIDLPVKKVADMYGVGTATISRYRKKYNLKSPNTGRPATIPIVKCSACGNETKNAKYCSRKCYQEERDPYDISDETRKKISDAKISHWQNPTDKMLEGVDKQRTVTDKFKIYSRQVRRLSEKNYAAHCDKINPKKLPRTLCGVEGGYQLDHIKSIKKCWNEGISIEEAASVNNLQMISWQDNLAKRTYECPLPLKN